MITSCIYLLNLAEGGSIAKRERTEEEVLCSLKLCVTTSTCIHTIVLKTTVLH